MISCIGQVGDRPMQIYGIYDYSSSDSMVRAIQHHIAVTALKLVISITCALPSLASDIAQAKDFHSFESARVFAPETHYMLNGDGTGLYHDFWNAIMHPEEDTSLIVVPYIRSSHILRHDNKSCRYPTAKEIIIAQKKKDGFEFKNLIWSQSFFAMTVHAFARPGLKPPKKTQDFLGKSIVAPTGYRFPPEIKKQNNVILTVSSEHQRATMLLSGRVDLMISSMPSTKFVMESLGIVRLPYDPDLTLKTFVLYLACHDTPTNRQLITKFNKGLTEARKQGSIKKIYSQYGLRPWP